MTEGNDKRTIIAIALCIAFYLAYTEYLRQKYPQPEQVNTPTANQENPTPEPSATLKTSQGSTEGSPQKDSSTTSSLKSTAPSKPLIDQETIIETDTTIYTFLADRAGLKSVKLKDFAQNTKTDSPRLEMVEQPLYLRTGIDGHNDFGPVTATRDGRTFRYQQTKNNWELNQEVTVPESGYSLGYKIMLKNNSDESRETTLNLQIEEDLSIPTASSMFSAAMGDKYFGLISSDAVNEKKELGIDCPEQFQTLVGSSSPTIFKYLGFDKHYFLTSISFPKESFTVSLEHKRSAHSSHPCTFKFSLAQEQGSIAARSSIEKSFQMFIGPKQVDVIEREQPILRATIDFGWFDFLAIPLLAAIQLVNKFTHNFGWTIIIVTALLKILFYPLTKAATVSAKRMQKLNPQMTAIREKYKDDSATMQKELMRFMSENKINPAKGCLPILPQIPVFIAFYNVLSQSIELRHAPFFGWIQDLSAQDPFYVSPILLGLGMFVQTKLTPSPGMDPTQQKIMLIMPIIFSVMMISLPSGMVIYMITNTIISIAQQQWLNRKLA